MLQKTRVRVSRVLRLQCWSAQFTFTRWRTLGYLADNSAASPHAGTRVIDPLESLSVIRLEFIIA